jgi:hypothetical protein
VGAGVFSGCFMTTLMGGAPGAGITNQLLGLVGSPFAATMNNSVPRVINLRIPLF